MGALLGGSQAGAAGSRPRVSASVKLQVVKLARQGKQAFSRKNYAGAVKHWRAAYGLWPRPQLLFNIALAYDKLGEPVQSLTFLREFRREATSDPQPKALLAAAEALETELGPRTAVLSLAAPAGARVKVDGVVVGVVPLEVVVLPGVRAIELSLPDRPVLRRKVELAAGRTTRLELELPVESPRPRPEPSRAPLPPPKGLHMGYCLGSAGLALALSAVAIVSGLQAVGAYDRFQASPSPSTRSEVVAWRDATNSLWAIAGVAGAAAVTLAVFTRWRRAPARETASGDPPRLELRVEGAGLSLTGAF
jgi:hypothetical protein